MTADTTLSLFDGQPLTEVELSRSPLVRVLVQARFESMGAFLSPDVVVPFVEQLLKQFPLYEESQETQLIISLNGISQQQQEKPSKIWRLRTSDRNSILTLSNGSLALETSDYAGRKEFFASFSKILTTFNKTIGTSSVTRIGVRYTNRINLNEVSVGNLRTFLRTEAPGGLAMPATGDVELKHSINDTLFSMSDGSLQARTGILPPNAVLDPSLPAIEAESWILDIDSYSETRREMTPAVLTPISDTLARRAYSLFRWIVTDDFLRHFGGDL